MPTPSRVAAVDVLLNYQALSTQAQRSALIHFAICPLRDLLLLIPSITSFASVGRALFQVRCFQVPTLMPVHKLILRRGNIHPIYETQIGHGGRPTFSTR